MGDLTKTKIQDWVRLRNISVDNECDCCHDLPSHNPPLNNDFDFSPLFVVMLVVYRSCTFYQGHPAVIGKQIDRRQSLEFL